MRCLGPAAPAGDDRVHEAFLSTHPGPALTPRGAPPVAGALGHGLRVLRSGRDLRLLLGALQPRGPRTPRAFHFVPVLPCQSFHTLQVFVAVASDIRCSF